MVISFQGLECFKISQGDLTLALNPISKKSEAKATSFGADITLISTNHPDFNGREQTSRGEKESFIISGPGEYEVKGVSVKGFLSESKYGGAKVNTIYNINLEGMNLCFLGALSNPVLTPATLESIEDIDVLFVPIGQGDPEGKSSTSNGAGVLNPAEAYKLAVSLEPKLIIPMLYNDKTLKQFLKEGGETATEPVDKLVIKKKDLESKEGEIVILKEE